MDILWYALRPCYSNLHETGIDGVEVVAAFEYPRYSVLAGQTGTRFIGWYPSEAEALEAYPQAAGNGCPEPASVGHLPDEDDPVPGGMYPDDWE